MFYMFNIAKFLECVSYTVIMKIFQLTTLIEKKVYAKVKMHMLLVIIFSPSFMIQQNF